MPQWNKIILSGSDAELNSVSSSDGLLVGATQQIGPTAGTTNLEGTFTGDLVGTTSTASYIEGSNIDGPVDSAVSASHADNAPFSGIYDTPTLVSASSQIDFTEIQNQPTTIATASYVELGNVDNFTSYSSSVSQQLTDLETGEAFSTGSFTGSFTGEFIGDGSQLTGIATELTIDGVGGPETVNLQDDNLIFDVGSNTGLGVLISTDTNGVIVTYSGLDAGTATKGVASFNSDFFTVSSGHVSIGAGAITETQLNASVAGTGLSGGGGSTLSVDYGSSAGTAVQGNTNITINGTTNEVAVTGTAAQALGAGPTYTIGLPSSVTISGAINAGSGTISGNFNVEGDLIVSGDTTQLNTTNVLVEDRFILLNSGSLGSNDKGGIVVDEGDGIGHALFYSAKGGRNRFGFNAAVSSSEMDADLTAYVAAVVDVSDEFQSDVAEYQKPGNIKIEDGEIYIYA